MSREDNLNGERYSRQSLFWGIGNDGQAKLQQARILVVGGGALGCASLGLSARGGIGRITIIDRDFVELSNLQRQLLFDESDAKEGLPKAVAAARAIARINSEVVVRPIVADFGPDNAEELVREADVVLDATDNFETRYLINDVCFKLGVPWVYGAAIGSTGMTATFRPGKTGCYRCVFPDSPPPGATPTCETSGVLGSIISSISAIQWTEAVKIIIGAEDKLNTGIIFFDLWQNDFNTVENLAARPECPCCAQRRFEFLSAEKTSQAVSLCGRNAVQVSPGPARKLDLESLKSRLALAGEVSGNAYLARLKLSGYELTIFPDGRAIIKGTTDESVARSLYSRYVGA